MVGVPARSKACHTCRKRRKGVSHLPSRRPPPSRSSREVTADRDPSATPSALPAANASKPTLPCGGYERARIFINSNAAAGGGGIISTPPSGGGSTALSHHRGTVALLASKFMATYEMLFVGDFGGGGGEGGQDLLAQARHWRSHNMGSLAIMEARTPWSVVDGPGHEIFPDSRLVWVSRTICVRRLSDR